MAQKPSLLRRVLRWLLLALASAVLIFLFYVAVVMGQPLADASQSVQSTDQPLPEPLSEPIVLTEVEVIRDLAEIFPAPVMYAGGKALTFVEGICEDVLFEDGVARVVTLTYRTADFDTLTLQSIYPARALSLLDKDGRTFAAMTQDRMVSLRYVAMQDAATLRLHAQGEEALYVLTTPLADSNQVDQWTNAMQLYRVTVE